MSEKKANGRFVLVLIGLVALTPFVASHLIYHFMPPAQQVNHGDLLETRPLADAMLTQLDGQPMPFSGLKGKWLLLTVDNAGCGDSCQRKLYVMRQLRLTQGKEMDRIERVWIIDDAAAPDPALLQRYEGAKVLRETEGALTKQLPTKQLLSEHIYIVDPLGNLVLRYGRDADPSRMIKDLSRLLKASRIG